MNKTIETGIDNNDVNLGATFKATNNINIAEVSVNMNMQRISVGELFTSSFFCIPAILLHNHGFILNSLLTWTVFVASLTFHRHNVESVNKPNPILRVADMTTTSVACIALIINGHNDLGVMLTASGVPIFYFFEKFVLYRNGEDASLLFGVAGWHMLLHISGITASCLLAFSDESLEVPIKTDVEAVFFGIIVAILFFTIFQPRDFGRTLTTEELISGFLGVSKTGDTGCYKKRL
jgi:hypothetical protein